MAYRVTSLRRYPVKAMGGEGLTSVQVDRRGLVGDRWYAVEDADGRFASGKNTRRFRRRDAVFAYSARTDPDGRVVVTDAVTEWTVGDPDLDEHLSKVFGVSTRVTPEADVPHQDMGSISVVGTATLEWCAANWGGDPDARRLRTNLVIETDHPFVEEQWAGSTLMVGTCRLRVVERIPRCRTIDIAQDGVVPSGNWLKRVADREMFLAVYADVIGPGTISVGAAVAVR